MLCVKVAVKISGISADANRFKDVVDRLGPAEALRIWKAAKPSEGHTVASFIAQQIEELSGVEKKTLGETW